MSVECLLIETDQKPSKFMVCSFQYCTCNSLYKEKGLLNNRYHLLRTSEKDTGTVFEIAMPPTVSANLVK